MVEICLAMIVKDEAAVIVRCLDSVIDFIDKVVICDTGSTDGTQEIVEGWYREKRVNGVLFEHEWKDFSTNRNIALDHARHMCSPGDYIMVMDADDVFRGKIDKRGFEAGGYVADGYMAKFRMIDLEWARPLLVRADKSWRYYFKVHELMLRSLDDGLNLTFLPDCHVECNVGGVYQGAQYFLDHAKLLEGENDPRSAYYLAQSYHCAGETELAIKAYARRTQMGGYSEETLVSWLRLGQLTNDPGCFLEATALNTTRPEGLFYAAEWCFSKGLNNVARTLLNESLLRTEPMGMFVERDVLRRAQLLKKELTK